MTMRTLPAFTVPTDAATAKTFLAELADAGLMFHPEDGAHDCLHECGLTPETVDEIDRCMRATFDHLADPCETALELINAKNGE